MATISKKFGKWYVQIRRSFHKPIYKSFIAKPDAQRWARETERLIEVGQFVDTTEANKTFWQVTSTGNISSHDPLIDTTITEIFWT